MSMDFSEFKRKLGAEPQSRDPAMLAARESSPEFEAAARAAEELETKLARSFILPVPDQLLEAVLEIPQRSQGPRRRRWPLLAMAASVLVAVGTVGLVWNYSQGWDSVEAYVIDHYRHDGPRMITSVQSNDHEKVQSILAEFDVQALSALADIVGVIKYCPTPDGRGVHMVLNTESGPVTVIYMPKTAVRDRETLEFDNVEAVLVELESGSAAIIGAGAQGVQDLHALVHGSIVPLKTSS